MTASPGSRAAGSARDTLLAPFFGFKIRNSMSGASARLSRSSRPSSSGRERAKLADELIFSRPQV